MANNDYMSTVCNPFPGYFVVHEGHPYAWIIRIQNSQHASDIVARNALWNHDMFDTRCIL